MKDVNQLLVTQKLAKLMAQVQCLSKLDRTLKAILPPPLQGSVNCAKLEQGNLTVITTNASIATQIRFSSQAIIMGLNEALPDQPIKTIRCLVRAVAAKPAMVQRKHREISAAAAENIEATAATICDEKLRLIWQSLGRKRRGSKVLN